MKEVCYENSETNHFTAAGDRDVFDAADRMRRFRADCGERSRYFSWKRPFGAAHCVRVGKCGVRADSYGICQTGECADRDDVSGLPGYYAPAGGGGNTVRRC